MRILVTNDDGIHAPGLALLEELARTLSDDVWTCAPAEENSGAGHSLTLHLPVRLREHGDKRFAVTGTPTDAVNLALHKLFDDRAPDLVLSGINNGENLADDVTYSGTINAAMEAALAGIPAIALSQARRGDDHGFAAAQAWGERVLRALSGAPIPPRTLVSVNFPSLPAAGVKGIKVVRQGFHDYARGTAIESTDPRGRPYFWFGLDDIEHHEGEGTDLGAIADGYVSVTPLQLDLTHEAGLAALAARF